MTRTRRRQILRYTIPAAASEGIRDRLTGTQPAQIRRFPGPRPVTARKAA